MGKMRLENLKVLEDLGVDKRTILKIDYKETRWKVVNWIYLAQIL
jgi:hypothetical protein